MSAFARLAPLCLAATAALPAMAQDADQLALVQALRGMDCTAGEAQEDALLAASGLSETGFEAAAVHLAVNGLITVAGGPPPQIVLAPALCAPEPAVMDQTLVGLLRLNNCWFTEELADAVFPTFGLTQEATRAAADVLRGLNGIVVAGSEARLAPAFCEGTGPVLPSPRGLVRAALRAEGCSMPRADLLAVLEGEGIFAGWAPQLLRQLADLEELQLDGDTAILPPLLCDPGAGVTDKAGEVAAYYAALAAALDGQGAEEDRDLAGAGLAAAGCTARLADAADLAALTRAGMEVLGHPAASDPGLIAAGERAMARGVAALLGAGLAEWRRESGEIHLYNCS